MPRWWSRRACDHGLVRLEPLVANPEEIVEVIAAAFGAPASFRDELDVDVYRLQCQAGDPGVVVRVVDDRVGRAALDTAATVLADLGQTRFPGETMCRRRAGGQLRWRRGAAPRAGDRVRRVEPGAEARLCAGLVCWAARALGRRRSGDGLPAGGGWHRLGSDADR